MNRIEIVGLFSALDKMCELKQYEAVESVIKKVLREAESKKKSDYKTPRIDDED